MDEQPTKPLRDAKGRLLPGSTANPLGRPLNTPTCGRRVREILANHSLHPAEELIKLLAVKRLRPKERISILTTLLEWSESKPTKETHNVNDNTNLNKNLDGLTTEQLVAALKTCQPIKETKEAPKQ